MMPRLDGFGLLHELRADERTRALPVILLSARAGEEARIEGLKAGADNYLVKPFSARELLAVIGAQIEIARVRRAAYETLETRVAERTEELTRSNQELEQFAYISAHDLQEPLRQVRAYVSMLKDRHSDKFEGKAAQYFDFVYDGVARMSDLVAALLAHLRVGAREKKHEAVSCNAALDASTTNLQVSIDEAHARITRDDLPTVTADPTQLTQLFQNLVGNAIKFRREGVTPEIHVGAEKASGFRGQESGSRGQEAGSLKLETESGAVVSDSSLSASPGLRVSESLPFWLFSVRDNGIGIPKEACDRIFAIFQRLHTREQYAGTGIGLAICKKIVERHGGRIWVESTPGEGSTFHFALPAGRGGEEK
jgi:hypothetical protein